MARYREGEESGGGVTSNPNSSGGVVVIGTKYLTIQWTHNETLPASMLKGFRVVVFTGADPNNTDNYLIKPIEVGPTERKVVTTLKLSTRKTVYSAIQAIYHNGNESSWRLLSGSAVIDPDTVEVAKQSGLDTINLLFDAGAKKIINFEEFNSTDWDYWEGDSSRTTLMTSGGSTGGKVLRCTGTVWISNKRNVPYDPNKLYRLRVRYRQVSDPSSGGKNFYGVLAGVAENGTTKCNTTGADSYSSQHYGPRAVANVAGDGWHEYVYYWKGTASTGTNGSIDPATPGQLHSNVRYIRPGFIVNYNSGNGVAEVDFIEVAEATDDLGVKQSTNALSMLTDISNDNLLTPGEKPPVIAERDRIISEQTALNALATAYGLTSNTTKTTYDAKVTALTNYLATLTTPVLWNTLTGNTTIVGSDFRNKFKDVYDAAETFRNAVSQKSKDLADAAQGSANSAASAAANAQTAANNAASAAAYADRLARSSYNLIKNGNSEDPCPTGFEAAGVDSTPGYARNGSKCRSITTYSAYTELVLTPKIQCAEGDEFYFEGWARSTRGTYPYSPRLLFRFVSATDTTTQWYWDEKSSLGTSWVKLAISGKAPAGTVAVEFRVDSGGTVVGGGLIAWDDFYACRKVSAGMLEGDAIQTTNYAEDGNGNPTAGARMDISGTALKVMPGGLRIGPYTFTDYWFRLLNAIDGSYSGGILVWRGNNDTTVRNGASNIDCLDLVISNVADNALLRWRLKPTSLTDNLDGMHQLRAQVFPVAGGATPGLTIYPELRDRYYVTANHGDAANEVIGDAFYGQLFKLLGTGYWNYGFIGHLLVDISNSYGWSAQRWYHSTASGWYTRDSTAPAGAPATGGSSAGGSRGGGCPAPWVPVLLASGLEVQAGSLRDGMTVVGVDDCTGAPSVGVLRGVERRWVRRVRVVLEDGRAPEFTATHRLGTVEGGWCEAQHLAPGQLLAAQRESRVRAVEAAGQGQVVSFEVEGCHTYFAGGLLSHNYKAGTI